MIVNCQECGRPFQIEPDQASWRVRCVPCWKHTKRAETRDRAWVPANPRLALLELENAALSAEVSRLRAEMDQAQSELDPETLRLLRLLCHPDRHNNSVASNRATVLLNKLASRANR